MPEREKHMKRIQSGRMNLLLMLALTAANIVLMLIEADFNFPFSAFVPQAAILFAQEFLFYSLTVEAFLCYIIAAVIVALFLLSWVLSKNRLGWLWLGLILFLTDTGVLLYFSISDFDASGIIDLLFHAWVLFYLIRGAISVQKYKDLPAEAPAPPVL